MQKQFEEWNRLKQKIEINRKPLIFHEGEVWFCSVGINVGREQDGKNKYFERPILIVRKFNSEMFWAVPLTSKLKETIFHHSFVRNGRLQIAILSQLSLTDVGRLRRIMFSVNALELNLIRDKIRLLI